MSRAERLLMLVQALRRRRRPVAGAVLADELCVSLRTLYRDIQALIGQGAPIEGEAGVGYVLKPGFMLPPLMFTEDEIEALVFGTRLAATRADERLASAAENALAKIAAVLPPDLADRMETTGLIVAPPWNARPDAVDLGDGTGRGGAVGDEGPIEPSDLVQPDLSRLAVQANRLKAP